MENKSNRVYAERSVSSLFVLRRAWLIGVCRKRDIERAFGLHDSPATVARVMRDAVNDYPESLKWVKRSGVCPVGSSLKPKEVSPAVMFDLLAKNAQPCATGIFDDDGVPVLLPSHRFGLADTESASEAILEAALHGRQLLVLYVGMRRNEQPKWRRVMPRALEYTGLYWRLRAQDIDDSERGFPIKAFVMHRILDAKPCKTPLPSGFRDIVTVKSERLIKVFLNEDLSEYQARTLKNGMRIGDDGVLKWPDHSLYEFKRELAGAPAQDGIVWPPITRIEELD